MTAADREAAAVVDGFAAAWHAPTSADIFLPLFTDDVVLAAPFFDQSFGRDAARAEFNRFFYLLRDVHGTVHRWAARDGVVFIEWTLGARFGRTELVIPTVDRIRYRNGLIAERVAYADTLPIMRVVARRPWLWPRVWRSGMAPWPRARKLMRSTTSHRRFEG